MNNLIIDLQLFIFFLKFYITELFQFIRNHKSQMRLVSHPCMERNQ